MFLVGREAAFNLTKYFHRRMATGSSLDWHAFSYLWCLCAGWLIKINSFDPEQTHDQPAPSLRCCVAKPFGFRCPQLPCSIERAHHITRLFTQLALSSRGSLCRYWLVTQSHRVTVANALMAAAAIASSSSASDSSTSLVVPSLLLLSSARLHCHARD